MTTITALQPKFDSHQSFYSKALIKQYDTDQAGTVIYLQSYETDVAEIRNGCPKVFGTFSSTTLRHIKEFLRQYGFKADSKSQIEADYMGGE